MSEQYYHTRDSVDEYIKMAEGYNGRKLIEKFRKFIPAQSSMLELGSGPGSDFDILKDDYELTGSDMSSEFLLHLRRRFSNGEFLELDAATLQTDRMFDTIYSNKVLHHLTDTDLKNTIQKQHDILNSKGLVCHSFWRGDGSEYFKGLFVNYHETAELNKLFKVLYDVLLVDLYMEFEPDDSILLIARKKT